MTGSELGIMVLLLLIGLAARWLTYRKPGHPKRQNDASRQPVVTIAVRGPVLKVPSMMDAYAVLPPHCQRVLGR
jgi:hypothetical protein